ncbi:MAG: hypothetical protein OEY34_10025 [Cyclobacteriaceae bacterium]|nr:hypothetical protein [Cyclobacteriaceae bacterium]
MKKYLIILFFFGFIVKNMAQNVGVSFSYFIPKNGEMSTPISPFSYRGVALPFTDVIGIQTGGSLYRMTGLNISGLPFQSKKNLYGPNYTLYVPLELYLQLGNRDATVTFKAGGFGFVSFLNRINYGNLDREIARYKGWDVLNSEFDFTNKPGYGYQGGVEFLFNVNKNFGITIEVNYLSGASRLNMEGSYSGGVLGGNILTEQVTYSDAIVDFKGLEISFGVVMGN